MSLLQYGFKRQKISNGLTQEDKQNPENHQIDLKNSNFNKTFKIKWLSERLSLDVFNGDGCFGEFERATGKYCAEQ